jgi:hypothetical protein
MTDCANTSQGSAAVSYGIFLYLEAVTREESFCSDKNICSHRLIPQPAVPNFNRDGLPIRGGHSYA